MDVRRLLHDHGLAPARARGQHFVVDPNTVRKVVREAGVAPGDLVCDVGAGLGSLTLALREAGAEVIAVEVDAGMVRALGSIVADDPGVTIVHADVLAIDLPDLLDGRSAVLVANLPYNIATPVVLRALEQDAFSALFVMVQREVGKRWVAGVGDRAYGAVSVKVAARARARLVARVSRRAFYPVPNVDSVTVRMHPIPWPYAPERDAVLRLAELGFAQRRKRLRNALAHGGMTPPEVEDALVAAGLDEGARAEELDVAAWVDLASALEQGQRPGEVLG